MRNIINEYLSQFDLDIRKSHDARFVDQKCTPDIVCFMADCVMNMVATKPMGHRTKRFFQWSGKMGERF